MYMILKQVSNTDNLWSFYTENGILWNTNAITEAIAKIEQLMENSGVGSVRLIRNMQFTASVAVADEPEENQDTPPPPNPE